MRFRSMLMTAVALTAFSLPARAQVITETSIDAYLAGVEAETTELNKVAVQVKDLDEKIDKFRSCAEPIREAGQGGGLKGKALLKAKCGSTSEEGMIKDRAKLLEGPEKVGAAAAGMKMSEYAQMKEKITMWLRGDTSFSAAELKAFAAREKQLAVFGRREAVKAADEPARRAGGGGIGNRLGNALGGAIAGQMQAFTTQLMWIYVQSLWSMMYVTGATMFETEYRPGQWTMWEIINGDKPDEKLVIERALLARERTDEFWRTKMIAVTPESSDTMVLEAQFQRMPEDSFTMKVVRTRVKMPTDTEGQELPVPENMSVLSMSAYKSKPTAESIKGATVGSESVRVGGTSYNARKIRFGQFGGGSMQWWLADNAPGGVVKVEYKGQEENQTWSWTLLGAGNGAKSELGLK